MPVAELWLAFGRIRFLLALLLANFVVVPLLVATLMQFLPAEPMVRLGVLLVLLTPCIDYVVTFSHMGRADARLLLVATPALLVAQMLLLPVYLATFLGADAAQLVHVSPFVHAFLWLIALPLGLASLTQSLGSKDLDWDPRGRPTRTAACAGDRAGALCGDCRGAAATRPSR